MPEQTIGIVTDLKIFLDAYGTNSPAFVYAKQYDTARYIRATVLSEDGKYRIESGCQLNITKPNGTKSFILGSVNTDDGTALFKLTSQSLSLDGVASCDISIFEEDDEEERTLTTSTFYITVEKSLFDEDAVEDQDEYSGVAEVLSQIGEVVDAAKDAEAWAVGKRDGTSVPSTDETYHNNAKYYAEILGQQAAVVVPMTGATDSADGRMGLVPTPHAGDNRKYLCGDGTWKSVESSTSLPSTRNLIKGNGSGGALAATPGTDYAIPSQIPTKIVVVSDANGDVVLSVGQ